MRLRAELMLVLFVFLPAAIWGASEPPDAAAREASLAREPYSYDIRQALVAEYASARDYPSAYYHAAWLAWLAPRSYADSEAGRAYLRQRAARDRASMSHDVSVSAALAAVQAKESLANTCFNGAIAQQGARLRRDMSALLARAGEGDTRARKADPVSRIALAHLCLALDDALVFEGTAEARDTRPRVLRDAASRAATVAAWLPQSPGARRTLAVARARLANLDGSPELWQLAIAEAERAYELDPGDPDLGELLRSLHLRAGNWAGAHRWQSELEAISR